MVNVYCQSKQLSEQNFSKIWIFKKYLKTSKIYIKRKKIVHIYIYTSLIHIIIYLEKNRFSKSFKQNNPSDGKNILKGHKFVVNAYSI